METMYERTRRLLRAHRGHYREIAEEAGVPIDWLHKVSQGVIGGQGVDRVERLLKVLEEAENGV